MPMPDTTELELRTDSVEQLIEVLEGDGGATPAMTWDRRQTVADRLRRQTNKPDAVAFCGLPGAGKSYTAENTADVYDAPVVSMGDAIRQSYKENQEGEATSERLGNYAASWRDEDPEGIPEKVAEMADRQFREHGNDLIIIDGVRSTTDYEVLKDYFDDFYLIEVEAEFYTRLSRLQKRGREGEASFTAIDLAERDEREREELGFGELCEYGCPDLTIKNGTGAEKLTISLSEVVENNLPFEIADGRPLGLDDELEGYRRGDGAAAPIEVKPDGGPVGE